MQKVSSVETLEKDPILECTHKDVEKCHYTYVTEFEANQEELCNENFEKKCQITFKKEAVSDKVKKCYRPQESACGNSHSLSQCLQKLALLRLHELALQPDTAGIQIHATWNLGQAFLRCTFLWLGNFRQMCCKSCLKRN